MFIPSERDCFFTKLLFGKPVAQASGVDYTPKHTRKVVLATLIAAALTLTGFLIACAIKGWNVGNKLSDYASIIKEEFNKNLALSVGITVGAGSLLLCGIISRICYVNGARMLTKNKLAST